MDIEGLSKTQIVLLTLLVSFVTSIATGIVTVSLLDQAPPGVTQTVHKVVERSVERVVPRGGQSAAAGESVKEVTTVVKEHDLITESIQKNIESVARIYTGTATSTDALGSFVGLGVVVSSDGVIATDRALLEAGGAYSARFADDTVAPLTYANTASVDRIALLTTRGFADDRFRAATFADASALKLGQSVITLAGRERSSVATGIIADLPTESIGTSTETRINQVVTDIDTDAVAAGGPLINIFNELVGIGTRASTDGARAAFVPISDIRSAIDAYRTATTTDAESSAEQQ